MNMEDGNGNPLIISIIISEESYECLELFVKAGANVNAVDGKNNTAIMHTMSTYFLRTEHKIKYVKLLLHAGSNVNMVNSANYNVLYRRYPLLFREWGKNSSHPGQRHQETCRKRDLCLLQKKL